MNDLWTRRLVVCFFYLALAGVSAAGEPPEWTAGTVWYKIITERFRNIFPKSDPIRDGIIDKDVNDWQVHPWASDWYKLQVWELQRDLSLRQLQSERRYGGDLIGVTEKLPYLKDLGVRALYFTPLFDSPSIEKYDATTFHHIDNNFGLDRTDDLDKIRSETEDTTKWTMSKADEVFLDLINQAHELKMKVVIEANFSFCSDKFWAFQDVKKKQEASAYKEWFEVLSWDNPLTPDTVEFDYKGWNDDRTRPLFRRDQYGKLCQPVRQYVFDSTRRWMDPDGDRDPQDGIDGWSARYVSDISQFFWIEWNTYVESINPEAVTICDVPLRNDGQAPFGFGLTFQSDLSQLITDFFVSGPPDFAIQAFLDSLAVIENKIAGDLKDGLILELSTVERGRFASMVVNGQHEAEGHNGVDDASGNGHSHYDPMPPDSTQRKLQKLAVLFQLTYPGAPMIYYGDESGMWGGKYPDSIKPMLWREFVYERESYETIRPDLPAKVVNEFDQSIFDLYRRMNEARTDHVALVEGDFEPRIVDEERRLLVYTRKEGWNEVWVFMNLGDAPQEVRIHTEWKKKLKLEDPLNQNKYKLDRYDIRLELEPLSARVLIKEK